MTDLNDHPWFGGQLNSKPETDDRPIHQYAWIILIQLRTGEQEIEGADSEDEAKQLVMQTADDPQVMGIIVTQRIAVFETAKSASRSRGDADDQQ